MSDVARLESSEFSHESSMIVPLDNRVFRMEQNSVQSSERLPPNGSNRSSKVTPVSVAVDPIALITTECITVTSAMRKHTRWAHSTVSAILGGGSSPSNPVKHGSRPATPGDDFSPQKRHKTRSSLPEVEDEGGLANRWGLRGKKGKSMQDNPLMAGFGRLRRDLTGCKGSFSPFSNQEDIMLIRERYTYV
jgi:hypothetical protein